MEKVTRRFCVVAFLCIIPFIFISCRSAPKPLAWTIEDAGWNDKYEEAHCLGEVSLALDSKGRPQILYQLQSPYEDADLVVPSPEMLTTCLAWQDNSATPPAWNNHVVDMPRMDVGETALRLCLTRDDKPVCAFRWFVSRAPTDVNAAADASSMEWKEMLMPTSEGRPGPQIFDVALDQKDVLLVVWFGGGYGHGEIPLYFARLEGERWKVETTGIHGESPYFRVSMKADAAGGIHVAYCTGKELKYAFRDSEGWRIETIDSVGNPQIWNSLDIDNSATPHIVYEDGKGNVVYARRDPLGLLGCTWNGWRTETVGKGTHPDIDVNPATGEPYVSLVRDGGLIFTRRVNGKWVDQIVSGWATPESWTDIAVHYDGSAPVSIAIAWQSGTDNNNIKFASAQFPKRTALFALFGAGLAFAGGVIRRKTR